MEVAPIFETIQKLARNNYPIDVCVEPPLFHELRAKVGDRFRPDGFGVMRLVGSKVCVKTFGPLGNDEPLTVNTVVGKSHMMAVIKGWWETDRSPAECIALMHSELSEALEEIRKPQCPINQTWHQEDGKPEGVGAELADTVIRIADFCGKFGIDLEAAIREKMKYNETRPYRHGGKTL